MAAADLPEDVLKDLIAKSFAMKERAYCPYSKYRVGAALLCTDGSIFTGCNVEFPGSSPTICAERTAIVKAVSEGNRIFRAIVIARTTINSVVGGNSQSHDHPQFAIRHSQLRLERKPSDRKDFISPCRVCRQAMVEVLQFPGNMTVYMTRPDKCYKKINLGALLRGNFLFKDLEEERVGT